MQKIAKNQLNVFFSWNHWLLKSFEEKQFSTSFPCMFATIFTIGFNCFRFCWFPFRENATSLEILVTHNCLFSTDFPIEYIATILGYLQSIFTSSDYLEYIIQLFQARNTDVFLWLTASAFGKCNLSGYRNHGKCSNLVANTLGNRDVFFSVMVINLIINIPFRDLTFA